MDQRIKVSCIMPTHNRSDLLARALDSLLAQSLKEIEIIVVDDASTDQTQDILAERMNSDPRVYTVKNDKNVGPALSRNKGYEAAKGEYIIFLDSDDYFLPFMLERTYALAKLYNCDLVVFERILAEDGQMPEIQNITSAMNLKLYEKGSRKAYINRLRNAPWNKLVSKKLMDQYQIRFQDLPASNDIFYSYAVALSAARTLITSEPLIVYFSNASGNISTSPKAMCCNEVLAYQKVFAFMRSIEPEDEIVVEMIEHAIRNIVGNVNHRVRKYGGCDINEKIAKAESFRDFLEHSMHKYRLEKMTQYFIAKIRTGSDMQRLGLYENYGKLVKAFCKMSAKINVKTALWGCGKIGTEILHYMDREDDKVDFVIDQNPEKQGTQFLGYQIHAYEEVCTQVDLILVSTHRFIEEITQIAQDKAVIDLYNFGK